MISFIVIGRNESWRLDKCFKSIYKLIDYNKINEYKIIYVDSDSTDHSIAIARNNDINNIYKISGNINAAIARNVGAKEAKGDILFFLDGDIELRPFNLSSIINEKGKLNFDYVVGFLDDVNYDNDWNFIDQTPRHYKTLIKDKEVNTVGGAIFIIPQISWNKYGGMDERLKRNQDRDLSLRMAKNGIKGLRKAEIFGLHHTIPYKDKKRMWEMIFNGSLWFKGVMIRKHLFNTSFYKVLIREESSLITLLLSIILIWFSPYSLFLYPIAVIIRNLKHISKGSAFFMLILHRILQDLLVFASILFYFPSSPKYNIKKI